MNLPLVYTWTEYATCARHTPNILFVPFVHIKRGSCTDCFTMEFKRKYASRNTGFA